MQGAAVAASVCAALQQRRSCPFSQAVTDNQKAQRCQAGDSSLDQHSEQNHQQASIRGLSKDALLQVPNSRDGHEASIAEVLAVDGRPDLGENGGKSRHTNRVSSVEPEGIAAASEYPEAFCDSLRYEGAVAVVESGAAQSDGGLQFAVLCSAYMPHAVEPQRLLRDVDVIQLPSLNFFAQGQSSKARQIPVDQSVAVQHWFQTDKQSTLRTSRGHAVPGDKHSISFYKSFLKQFVIC